MNDSTLFSVWHGNGRSKNRVLSVLQDSNLKQEPTEEMRHRVAQKNKRARQMALLQMQPELRKRGNQPRPTGASHTDMRRSLEAEGLASASSMGFVQRQISVRQPTDVLPHQASCTKWGDYPTKMQAWNDLSNFSFAKRLLYPTSR